MFVEGYSYKEIVQHLNSQGRVNNLGQPFKPNLLGILLNRKYIGEYTYNRAREKTRTGKRYHWLSKPESQIIRIPGGMPRIIDDATFEKAAEIIRNRTQHMRTERKYLLAGLIKCACGHAMAGETRRGGRNKVIQYVYRCIARRKKTDPCNVRELKMDKMDEYVLKYLKSNLLNSKCIEKIYAFLSKKIAVINKSKIDLSETQRKIDQVQASIDNLVTALAITKNNAYNVITAEIEKLTGEKERLEEERYTKSMLTKTRAVTMLEVEAAMEKYEPLLDSDDVMKQRAVLQEFIKVINIDNDYIRMTICLNGFYAQNPAEQLSYEVKKNRDLIILGKLKKYVTEENEYENYQTEYQENTEHQHAQG